MARTGATRDRRDGGSKVVGIRMPKDLAREVKTEAARRGVKLNQLFSEMWQLYKASPSKAAP